jgi:hypothetical protein
MFSKEDFQVIAIWDWYDGPLSWILVKENRIYFAHWTAVEDPALIHSTRIYSVVTSPLIEHFILCDFVEFDPKGPLLYWAGEEEMQKLQSFLSTNSFYSQYPKRSMIPETDKAHHLSRNRLFGHIIDHLVQKEIDEGRVVGEITEDILQ